MTRRILRPLVLVILAVIYAVALALVIDERGSRHREPERVVIQQNWEAKR